MFFLVCKKPAKTKNSTIAGGLNNCARSGVLALNTMNLKNMANARLLSISRAMKKSHRVASGENPDIQYRMVPKMALSANASGTWTSIEASKKHAGGRNRFCVCFQTTFRDSMLSGVSERLVNAVKITWYNMRPIILKY